MRAFQILILTAGAVPLASVNAGAADVPPIRVSVPACSPAPFSVEGFLGSLAVELAGHVPACCVLDQTPPAVGAPTGLRVTLSIDPCDQSATSVAIHVRDPDHATDSERRVGLGDIPLEARPRALALAVAELVHSATAPPAAPAMTGKPTAPPGASSPGAGDPGGAPHPRVPWIFVSGLIEVETHPGHNMSLWGMSPSLTVARSHWQGALEVGFLLGDSSVTLGDVRTGILSGTLAAGPRFSLGQLILDLSACGRLGWAWMSGHTSNASADPTSGSAPFASASARLGIILPTAAQVSHLRAFVEAGAMIHGLEATVNGNTVAGMTGGYLLFALGFGSNR